MLHLRKTDKLMSLQNVRCIDATKQTLYWRHMTKHDALTPKLSRNTIAFAKSVNKTINN